jgi:hypothetical protein
MSEVAATAAPAIDAVMKKPLREAFGDWFCIFVSNKAMNLSA